ncbi:MAG: DNA-processing protein DprA, partial [Anaerolineaceae bacterium]|nr:DNA-processing protein DprA [Anaerolineaceae bacterium]
NADKADLQTTAELAAKAATQEIMVISGGARGVDQSAMLEALHHGGIATGVLADGLLRATTSARYREHISAGRLVLISPYHPEASFNVGNAMDRNKYIYCLSTAAIVISCAHGKGGTWRGAQQNMKERWGVPLWFNRIEDYEANNPGPGGFPLPYDRDDLSTLSDSAQVANEGMYWHFLGIMERFIGRKSLKSAEIYSKHGLRKSQVDMWLKRGVEEGRIEKLKKPVRYRFRNYEADETKSDRQTEYHPQTSRVSGNQPRVATQPERQLALPGK